MAPFGGTAALPAPSPLGSRPKHFNVWGALVKAYKNHILVDGRQIITQLIICICQTGLIGVLFSDKKSTPGGMGCTQPELGVGVGGSRFSSPSAWMCGTRLWGWACVIRLAAQVLGARKMAGTRPRSWPRGFGWLARGGAAEFGWVERDFSKSREMWMGKMHRKKNIMSFFQLFNLLRWEMIMMPTRT